MKEGYAKNEYVLKVNGNTYLFTDRASIPVKDEELIIKKYRKEKLDGEAHVKIEEVVKQNDNEMIIIDIG